VRANRSFQAGFFALILILFLILTSVFLLSPREARAHPTELILAPTARIMPYDGSVGAGLRGGRGRIFGSFRIENFIELGGQVETHPRQDTELGILAKVRLISEGAEVPDISLGIQGRSLYLAASKAFARTNLHFGLADGGLSGIFLGLNQVINPGELQLVRDEDGSLTLPQTSLMLEYFDQAFNFGARMNLTPEVTAELSILNLDSVKAEVNFNF